MSENTEGLPEVPGLENVVDQPDKDQEEQKEEPKEQPAKLFKSLEDAETGYVNVQGAYTKVTQENKELREQLERISEQVQLMQLGQTQAPPPAPEFDPYSENAGEQLNGLVSQKVHQEIAQAQIAATLEEINLQNPEEFQDRYAYAKLLSQRHPNLVTSPAGVKKLFELGDKQRTEDMRRNAQKSVSMLFGDDIDIEKLRTLIRKDPGQPNINNAYMPDTTQSTRTEPVAASHDAQMSRAEAEGDIDGVIDGLFKKVLGP